MTHKESSHRKALEKIVLHPKEFGIEDVVYAAIESRLFDRKKLIAEPDILFYCLGGDIYIIEYKGNGNGELLKRAQDQLTRAVFWFGKYTSIDSNKIHTQIITGQDLVQKLNFYTRT